MIYFDNAATGGSKPDTVQIAVSSAIKVCANPGRSGHPLSLACAMQVQNCRYALNDMFDGYGFDRIVFTKNNAGFLRFYGENDLLQKNIEK
jgi:selenocysteine lyase/cysteine desulfurase